jgi:hypothetical protein
MIKRIAFCFFCLALFFNSQTHAQVNILLLSGNRVNIKDYRIDSSGVVLYKDKHDRIHGFEQDEVFSVTRADSVEVIIYKPACTDVCFRINQMRDYLNGTADGKQEKTFWYGAGNFAVGAASGYLFPFLSPLAPAAASTVIGIVNPKVGKLNIPEQYKDNQHYIEGYTKSVKRKRVMTSILGGGVGIVVGIGVLAILTK